MRLVTCAEPLTEVHEQEQHSDQRNRGEDRHNGRQRRDSRDMASQGSRPDLPAFRPVRTDLFVVGGSEEG